MIKSMTGFGKGTQDSPYGKIAAEIKALNHRSLSITCSPFNGFFLLEENMKAVFEDKLFRGKIFVKVTNENVGMKKSLQKIEINENIAQEYLKKIGKLKKNLNLEGDLQIAELVKFPGVVENGTESEEKIWPYIEKALKKALNKLIKYRKTEGVRLAKDFNARLRRIEASIRKIKKYGKQSVTCYRKKLVKSIREIAKNTKPDKSRLETEVALFAKNCDIAEEITRLKGHLASYKEAMSKVRADVGKKLDFIAQEMQREANTIGAKSSDFGIAKMVIEVKSEIEKIREQIKNIE